VEALMLFQNDIPVRIVESVEFLSSTDYAHASLAPSVFAPSPADRLHAVL
jgi:hypothetical protein